MREICLLVSHFLNTCTGISSQMGTKLRDWVVWQASASCYSQTALSSNDSKTLYMSFESWV